MYIQLTLRCQLDPGFTSLVHPEGTPQTIQAIGCLIDDDFVIFIKISSYCDAWENGVKMNKVNQSFASEHVYRIDRFIVPEKAREEFLPAVRRSNEILRALPGFVQDLVFEQRSGSGDFTYITIVEWADSASVENAKIAITARYRELNFSPQELMTRLGIKGDQGYYHQLEQI